MNNTFTVTGDSFFMIGHTPFINLLRKLVCDNTSKANIYIQLYVVVDCDVKDTYQ